MMKAKMFTYTELSAAIDFMVAKRQQPKIETEDLCEVCHKEAWNECDCVLTCFPCLVEKVPCHCPL